MATPATLEQAPGSVGRPLPGNEVRLVPPGGHILVRGPWFSSPAPTAGATPATWDAGTRPATFTWWDGPSSMVVSGGENVFPHEIEEVLLGHPQIGEASLVVVPDDEFGQRMLASLVAQPDLTVEALRDWLRQRLERYKMPRHIAIMAQLPRNPLGKIDRAALRQLLLEDENRHMPEGPETHRQAHKLRDLLLHQIPVLEIGPRPCRGPYRFCRGGARHGCGSKGQGVFDRIRIETDSLCPHATLRTLANGATRASTQDQPPIATATGHGQRRRPALQRRPESRGSSTEPALHPSLPIPAGSRPVGPGGSLKSSTGNCWTVVSLAASCPVFYSIRLFGPARATICAAKFSSAPVLLRKLAPKTLLRRPATG